MPHNLNGATEIHYWKGSTVPLEAVVEGNPDLTEGGHVLEFYLARWWDNAEIEISKSTEDDPPGILTFVDGRYLVEVDADVDPLVLERPYRFSVFYTPPGGERDVTAQGTFRVIGTVDGAE